jgi:3-carboxy-cis,cis-muconate cycloisomerase
MNLLARAILGRSADAPYSDRGLLAAMLRVEVALAQSQARLGLIPAEAAAAIATQAAAAKFDLDAIVDAAAHAGSLAIPFVQALTQQVRALDPAACAYVHFGATTQDLLDTAVVLCTREAVARLEQATLAAVRAAARHARQHAHTPTLARTLLQPAGVTTVGLRCAQWAHALHAARRRLLDAAHTGLAVSLGGATGNLAAWGEHGGALRAELARSLGLHDGAATWHTHRGDWINLAAQAALLAGTSSKIAHDIASAAAPEVGELAEPIAAGRGGSTAMPHKRNPVLALRVIAAAQPLPGLLANLLSAMPQEHERALGNWQAELAQVPMVFGHALAAATALRDLLEGLEVRPQGCRANIDATLGTVFSEALTAALLPALGRSQAQALVAELCREALARGVHLRTLLRGEQDARLAALAPDALDALFDLTRAASASAVLVEPLLAKLAE